MSYSIFISLILFTFVSVGCAALSEFAGDDLSFSFGRKGENELCGKEATFSKDSGGINLGLNKRKGCEPTEEEPIESIDR